MEDTDILIFSSPNLEQAKVETQAPVEVPHKAAPSSQTQKRTSWQLLLP
ncbi:MAG: hypothetical protein HC817_10100 [Saprospiraceae bacterium]|nr:hypothetical protein [Saprospiraceae bacterium]